MNLPEGEEMPQYKGQCSLPVEPWKIILGLSSLIYQMRLQQGCLIELLQGFSETMYLRHSVWCLALGKLQTFFKPEDCTALSTQ